MQRFGVVVSVLLAVVAAGSLTLGLTSASQAAENGLPLGDGKGSRTTPQAGGLLACQTPSRPAAAHTGPWIQGDLWFPSLKPAVSGSVAWPQADVTSAVRGRMRTMITRGVPVGATTGSFPIASTDPAYQYDRNPNAITPARVSVQVPADPVVAAKPSCLPMGAIGFATNGVAIYNAIDDDSNDAVAHEMQDACDGHPQGKGQYHYHNGSRCLVASASGSSSLYGYAFDGFGIFIERDAQGRLLTNADLDECHGRTSSVKWNGRKKRIYHYVVTAEYPYTVGCYRGTPTALRPTAEAQILTPERPNAGRPTPDRPPIRSVGGTR